MKYVDVFAGAGGFRIPLEKKGHKCVWSCENDRFARRVYRYRFGEWPAGDIRDVDTRDVPDHDLFCAGFPCQAFSIAGKRQGFKDTRGTLFYQICRILEAKRPKLVLLENVQGLLSHGNYRTFFIILESLRELGYVGSYQVLNAVNWLPQNRPRVFIVGSLGDGRGGEIFPITEDDILSQRKNITTERQPQAETCGTIRGLGNVKADTTLVQVGHVTDAQKNSMGGRVYDARGCAPAIKAVGGGLGAKTGLFAVVNDRGKFKRRETTQTVDANYHKGPEKHGQQSLIVVHNLQPRSSDRPSVKNNSNAGGSGHICKDDGTTYCLKPHPDQALQIEQPYIQNIPHGRNTGWKKKHPNLRSADGAAYNELLVNNASIRRLTPRECERLQGFPDDWTRWGLDDNDKRVNISDRQRYKLMGNAVNVKVVETIVNKIDKVTP